MGVRLVRDFEPPWNIFGVNEEDDPQTPQHLVANEVDLAPLVWGHNGPNPGDLFTDQAGNSFVAAVSRVDEMLLGQVVESRIELKLFAMRQHPITQQTEPVMYDMSGGEFWGPDVSYEFNMIPGRDVTQDGEDSCKSPRVIARGLEWSSGNLNFEILVAYEVRDDQNPVTISVYRSQCRMSFFPGNEIAVNTLDESWTPVVSDTGGDCLFPDLEFGPTSGYTHLVYTHYQPEGYVRDARIHYRARAGYNEPFSGYAWLNESDRGDNGWIPRIDVGTVTDPFHFEAEGDVMTVAVVYTRQETDPHQGYLYGYRSYVRYWKEDEGPGVIGQDPNTWQLPVVNGDYEPDEEYPSYRGSGLPVIDIAPESNCDHDAYVSFVQQESVLPDPIRHSVFVVGHAFQGQQLVVHFIPVHNVDDGTSVLPSICMHYGVRQMSITYYHQCTVGLGPWTVMANRVEYLGTPMVMLDTPIDTEAYGSFNIAELANYNFGVASGLAATVTENEPSYFASWSDAVGIVCEPCHIQATFGFTIPI